MKKLTLTLALVLALGQAALAQVRPGDPAPEVRGTFTKLQASSLGDLRGRVVLLEFWRTW